MWVIYSDLSLGAKKLSKQLVFYQQDNSVFPHDSCNSTVKTQKKSRHYSWSYTINIEVRFENYFYQKYIENCV